jgi:Tol biopolymer transport system component
MTRMIWMSIFVPGLVLGLAFLPACSAGSKSIDPSPPGDTKADLGRTEEVHLRDVVQLTRDAGENAEAYWSADGSQLIFQTPFKCDQIMRVPADGSADPALVSTGQGRTTCAFFFPGDKRVLWSSTHLAGPDCPPPPDMSRGYVWALYDSYDIFSSNPDGTDVRQLTATPGYDAEATVCGKDGSIVFTSTRDGDIDLYRMDADGKNVVRLTDAPGYDGGAFFSPDCSQLVWRASRPTGKALADYQALLAQGLVRPSQLEIFVGDADGGNARQVTYLGAASFAPYFHPSGQRILFSSNYPDPRGREFDIWAIDVTGANLERITASPGFDGFPAIRPKTVRPICMWQAGSTNPEARRRQPASRCRLIASSQTSSGSPMTRARGAGWEPAAWTRRATGWPSSLGRSESRAGSRVEGSSKSCTWPWR